MSATENKSKIDPEDKGGMNVVVLAILTVLLVAIVGAGAWVFAIRDTTPEFETRGYDTELSELESRGFTDVQYVSTLEITSTPVETNGETPSVGNDMYSPEEVKRFHSDLGDCRVRIHIDDDGLVVLIKDEYRVVDPDDTLLKDDPVFGKCLGSEAPTEPVG